jgi:hypothetical protein
LVDPHTQLDPAHSIQQHIAHRLQHLQRNSDQNHFVLDVHLLYLFHLKMKLCHLEGDEGDYQHLRSVRMVVGVTER